MMGIGWDPLMILLLGFAGGCGALVRWGIDRALSARGGRFPLGILVVNLSGSFLIGVLAGVGIGWGATLDEGWLLVLSGGFVGGYTTFSTAMVDSVRLITERRGSAAILNTLGMAVGAVAVVLLGTVLGSALFGSVLIT